MAIELRLEALLSETGDALTLALSGIPFATTEVTFVDIWWAYEDDISADGYQRVYLGAFEVGATQSVPFPQTSRQVRFWQHSRIGTGVESQLNFDTMEQVVFTPSATPEGSIGQTIVAAETLTRGMLIDLYDDGGTLKARKSDATDNTRLADAFVDADVSIGANGTAYFAGSIVRGLSGLTQGEALFLSETSGGVTHTPPTGTGKVVQQVGTALSVSSFVFDPQEPVELAA